MKTQQDQDLWRAQSCGAYLPTKGQLGSNSPLPKIAKYRHRLKQEIGKQEVTRFLSVCPWQGGGGHQSGRLTERSTMPWVREREERMETNVRCMAGP